MHGARVWYRDHEGTISEGLVVEMRFDHIEVFWPDLGKTTLMRPGQLWAIRPDWTLDERCVCGCTFGAHSESGCIEHQVHRFWPSSRPREPRECPSCPGLITCSKCNTVTTGP